MNEKVTRTVLSVLRSLIVVVGAGLSVIVAMKSTGGETIDEGISNYGTWLDGALVISEVAMIACAAAAVIFGLIYFLGNIKSKMASLYGVLAFAGLAIVSFFVLSGNEVLSVYKEAGELVSPEISQMTGGGLILVYLLSAAALVAIVWTEVGRFFK
ncbi:MAG: hypothetical protein RL226_1151 [Bacteroidota bacterium]|jgi:hypothetical protein